MSPDQPAPPAIRRALEADAPAIAALLPRGGTATADERATFVMDAGGQVVGVLELAQPGDYLVIDRIVVAADARGRGYGKLLVAFAEAAAREVEVREVRLGPQVPPNGFFAALGYASGGKQIAGGALRLASQHLEAVGVPLLRDGSGPLGRVVYYRAVWIAVAMIVAIGSSSLAIFTRGEITILHLVGPAMLCLAGTSFALWQLFLIVVAARRAGSRPASWLAVAAAAAAFVAIDIAIYDKAVPQLTELWTIYAGDAEMNDFAMVLGDDGRSLHFAGTLGSGTEIAMRRALDANPGVREIVLQGPGGRLGPAYELHRLIRKRQLATRVDGDCTSACAIVFLGGVERNLGPQARLGFHQAGFPGMNPAEMLESNRAMVRFLVVQAGLTSTFANRVVETPPSEIWLPSLDELGAGRVIHRVVEEEKKK